MLTNDSATELYLSELHELRIRVRDCLEDMIRLWPGGRAVSRRIDRDIQAVVAKASYAIEDIQALEAWISLYKGVCRALEEVYLADEDEDDDDVDGEAPVEQIAKFSSARTRGLQPASTVAAQKSPALDDVLSSCLTTLVEAMEYTRAGLEHCANSSQQLGPLDLLVTASVGLLGLLSEARWLVAKINDVNIIFPITQFILAVRPMLLSDISKGFADIVFSFGYGRRQCSRNAFYPVSRRWALSFALVRSCSGTTAIWPPLFSRKSLAE